MGSTDDWTAGRSRSRGQEGVSTAGLAADCIVPNQKIVQQVMPSCMLIFGVLPSGPIQGISCSGHPFPPPLSPPDEHLLPHLEILSKSLYFSLTSGTAFSRNRSPASGVLCMPPISWPKPSTSRQSALNTVMHRILYFRSVCMTLYLHT